LREILGYSPVGSTAGLSESKIKRVRSTPGAPPPIAPLAGSAIAASMAPTAAARVSPPVGKAPETVAPARPRMPEPPLPVPDSESPTITTGRRMGELMAKGPVPAAPPPPKKKGFSPFVLGGGLLAVLAVVLGVLALSKRSEKGVSEPPPVPTSPPAVSAPAPAPTSPPPASKPTQLPAATSASTAGPSIAIVETPVPGASPTLAPTKKARVKPTAAPEEAATAAAVAAVPPTPKAKAPAQKLADLTITVRRFLRLDISPDQARVYLDGHYIGIADDWDDSGGGSLLVFPLEGTHRLRLCAPERRDLNVDLVVRATATDDKVTIDHSLEKGSPDGPTGPSWLYGGKLKHPNYKTTRDAVFNVQPPEATVLVNGREVGPASKFAKEDLQFADMAVYEVLLTAPGYESKPLRVLVSPAAGEARAHIKEKLKKM
ncbi:MAG TPA: hypothetical protein VKS23_06515, partial [Thermoanaerobaculia bacterium]|nr:hypothetical protein [Thermoanaerobaculia bacterium]